MKSNGKLISYLAKTGELRTPFVLQADVDLLGTDVGCGIILYVLFPCLLCPDANTSSIRSIVSE